MTGVTLASAHAQNDALRLATFSGRVPVDALHNEGMKAKKLGQRDKRPSLAPQDQALFQEAMESAGVTPLGARDRIAPPKPPPAVTRVVELPPEVKLTVDGAGERYAARAPGVSLAQIGELRSGKIHATATLDLHGTFVAPATQQLRQFLIESRRTGHRCVLIVHGRGVHSEQGAPLRDAVLAELLGSLSGLVHAFAVDGNAGATYVMIKGVK